MTRSSLRERLQAARARLDLSIRGSAKERAEQARRDLEDMARLRQ